jgi:outer membrane receptor protein involved in Fe transport
MVVAPNFVPNLVASVDYYNIEIEDAIGLVSAQDIVDFCYDSSSLDNDFCPLFTRRDDNGGLNFLRQTFLNFAAIKTAGIDFALSYSRRIGPIDLGLRANATWVDRLDRFTDPTDPTIIDPELGEIQRPEWAGRGTVTLGYGGFRLGYTLQYVGEQGLRAVEVETAAAEFGAAGFVNESYIHDLSFSYDINDATQLYGGINNFTDEEPFITEQAYPVSGLGRYFFFGINTEL